MQFESRPNGKKVATQEEAWEAQEKYDGKPHGWVQWKGTDACMDVRCKCGYSSHIDAEFLYHVQCPECKTIYMCNGHIELIEITDPEAAEALEPLLADK